MALSWFPRLWKSKSRPAPSSSRPARARLGLEGLETRNLMSITAIISSGQLDVLGDNTGNRITVDHSQNSTIISGTGLQARSFLDSSFSTIQILPGSGHNSIVINGTN